MNKINFLITLITISLLNLTFVSAISMTRDVPTTATGSFQLTYTVSGATGTWGASIVDSVSGGCKFPDGTNQLRTVMLSADGNTKQIILTSPASGSCTFTGDYKFGTDAIVNFPSTTITITTNGVCVPNNSCVLNTCVGQTCTNNCGQTIQGTKTGCGEPPPAECHEYVKKLAWFDFTTNDCTNGYIIGAIILFVSLLIVARLLK